MKIPAAMIVIAFAAMLGGCATPAPSRTYVDRLLDHPQFKAAARSAPEFTRAALDTVADLESEIRRKP